MLSRSRLGTLLAVVAVFGLAPREASALTYTNVVNTPNEYSFDFTGTSDSKTFLVIFAVAPVGWQVIAEVVGADSDWTWAASTKHVDGGAPLFVSLEDIAYGQQASGSMTLPIPNGPGFDSLEMTFVAAGNGRGGWGDFSGRFSAVRTGAAVPDAGSTVTLIGLALLGLVAVRRKLS